MVELFLQEETQFFLKLKKRLSNDLKEKIPFDLNGSVIMHTAVSDARIAPTTSNKEGIESSMIDLAKNGVKIHIGKGTLSEETKTFLCEENSIFVVTPPVAALLTNSITSKKALLMRKKG